MNTKTLSEKQKMKSGQLYRFGPELAAEQLRAGKLLEAYNLTSYDKAECRTAILTELLGSLGKGTILRPPFYCDYGYNIFLGAEVFLNYSCILLDVAPIRIGDFTQIGPAVQIYAADHPRDSEKRLSDRKSVV